MKNRRTAFKVFVDFEKELEYISSMNAAGWKLTAVRFGCLYSFERCSEGEYTTLFVGDDSQNESLQKRSLEEGGYQVIPYKYDLKPTHLYITRKSDIGEDEYYSTPEQKQFLLEGVLSQYDRAEKIYSLIVFVWNLFIIVTAPVLARAIQMLVNYGDVYLMIRVSLIIALELFGDVSLCIIIAKLGKCKKKYKRQLLELKDRIKEKRNL